MYISHPFIEWEIDNPVKREEKIKLGQQNEKCVNVLGNDSFVPSKITKLNYWWLYFKLNFSFDWVHVLLSSKEAP